MGSKHKKKESLTDDEILNQYIQSNEQCHLGACTKSIKLIKLQCHLCTNNFCTSHVLPESHGCGGAARKEAAGPQKNKKYVDNDRKAQLENRLSRKLKEMSNERKKK